MSTILLNDILHMSPEEILNTKVKFNQQGKDSTTNPIDEYKKAPEIVDTQWLFWRETQRYFSVGQNAMCFLKLSSDTWLMTTIKVVTKELNVTHGVNYEGNELGQYQRYFGRVIVKYRKTHQTQGVYLQTVIEKLEVVQILPVTYDGDEFPGYDNIRLSYDQLETIIHRKKSDWITALANQKAVYLITDKSNGKMYVGSATSQYGMLLSRWEAYINSGHGGNVDLKILVDQLGLEYVKANFQYSVLENYNQRVDDNFILSRESYWKQVLCSKKFGYNLN